MAKKVLLSVFLFLFFFLIPPVFYIIDYSQVITTPQEQVAYNLPYPGLLPDHPLYFLKVIRDRVLEFATRDNLKKVELYLLYSDKRAAMALPLANKGKDKLAISTISKGEKYFLKIPKLIDTSKKQGSPPSPGLVNDLKVSNSKHLEIIQTLLKQLPQGQTEEINEVLKINKDLQRQLEKL